MSQRKKRAEPLLRRPLMYLYASAFLLLVACLFSRSLGFPLSQGCGVMHKPKQLSACPQSNGNKRIPHIITCNAITKVHVKGGGVVVGRRRQKEYYIYIRLWTISWKFDQPFAFVQILQPPLLVRVYMCIYLCVCLQLCFFMSVYESRPLIFPSAGLHMIDGMYPRD